VKTRRATQDRHPIVSIARGIPGPDSTLRQRLETFFLARRAEVRAAKLSDSA